MVLVLLLAFSVAIVMAAVVKRNLEGLQPGNTELHLPWKNKKQRESLQVV